MLDALDKRTAPESLVNFAKAQINDVLMNVKGVEFVMVCSTDGFELGSVYRKSNYNTSKLAAVGSSILAMVSAFLNEINLTGCHSITLDAENGKAVLTSVPAPKHPMVIVTLVAKDVLLGQLLYALKEASVAIIKSDK
ncbi:roadblock/LC7 domain-containing protein [Acinetobacter shaoyimingii]|uniref:Roadblock/LC7 domain-containing protein n=1 Tax=Acinetobacter shaoyimingii TaxID=2715164 RepID=A0A6G8RT98_9GAMM|nr:roadblock/LC7 domain-containing protein [Acinetobacter shaoyimingii]NHB59290.1 roadblock/LC7 domain-containing protein [Acinetobacter shaoyimingii]QIO05097.1 roadblock/LC7 domain-containing protein [Acinetobacter shaoyimingii]